MTQVHHQRIIALHHTFVSARRDKLMKQIREVVQNASQIDFSVKFTPGMFSVYCQDPNPTKGEIIAYRLVIWRLDHLGSMSVTDIIEGPARFLIRYINENRNSWSGVEDFGAGWVRIDLMTMRD